MALVSGYLRDFADVAHAAGLAFIPERPATAGSRLLSTKAIDTSLAANGWFEQNLIPTYSTTPPTTFTVRIVFDANKHMDVIRGLVVPEIGGNVANLAAAKSERITFAETQPPNMQVGDIWVNTVTGDMYEEDGRA